MGNAQETGRRIPRKPIILAAELALLALLASKHGDHYVAPVVPALSTSTPYEIVISRFTPTAMATIVSPTPYTDRSPIPTPSFPTSERATPVVSGKTPNIIRIPTLRTRE